MKKGFWKVAALATAFAFVAYTNVARSDDKDKKDKAHGGAHTGNHGDKKTDDKKTGDKKHEGEHHAGAEIGKPAPLFMLKNHDGKEVKLADYKDKIVVLEWYNINCPVCQEYCDRMKEWAKKYSDKGVVWLAIDSTHNGSDSSNAAYAKKHGVNYPILNDFDGKIGHAYGASTTPHMFVINKGTLVYSGAIDDSANKGKAKKNYVAEAIDAVMAGKPVATTHTKPFGCSVKYKK